MMVLLFKSDPCSWHDIWYDVFFEGVIFFYFAQILVRVLYTVRQVGVYDGKIKGR